jgi:acyl-CoA synthetase (AMP-forming)/AMP-acid ligase II/alkylation response protein AidB-like acyl-CoA dehydrogenase/acyl carrier protein
MTQMKVEASLPALVSPTNVVDLLRARAEIQPNAQACLYLGDGEEIKGELTFAQLDRQSRAVAARLQGLGASGECAILVYPPGLEFLSAFFGCLYAGVIAVPLPVPRLKASIAPFLDIIRDVHARIVLTTATAMTRVSRLDVEAIKALVSLSTEETPEELASAWRAPATAPDSVAYLQYTSGSTASRKGVMVTHRNVIANLRGIGERFRHQDHAVCVNWLPHIHDLGLVSGMLQPLYHGHRNIMMSPNAFVQRPIRWLNAISQYRGTYTNSPNFGYDLCVRRTTAEQRARLDLSSWQVALNGAEPVRHQTIEEFATMFGPCGFRRQVMFPAYGLAEATLVVSGGLRDALPIAVNLDVAHLERDRVVETERRQNARAIVGCGHALEETSISIVDPVSSKQRAENEIGEIWVRGAGVAAGYWRDAQNTEQTFHSRLADDDGHTYLRTGDLGFLRDGELFITGRLKDLIIIRGDNHYPQDIEFTVEQSHPQLRPGCGAAFSVDADGSEQLVVAYELERDHLRAIDGEEIARTARRAVAEQHDLHLHTLVLLKTGTVPRTSSGKIQRRQCRADFLEDALSVVWRSSTVEATAVSPVAGSPAVPPTRRQHGQPASAADLCVWLRDYATECVNSRLMDERRSIAPHVVLDFGNRGVLGLLVPREYGGAGFGYRDTLQVIEQLGAIDQTLTMMAIVHNVLGIGPILHHGHAQLKEEWLPQLASGRELVAFAITEPTAGSNPQGIMSTATPDGVDAWRLHGQKSWSGTAGWASVINVFAQNVDADGNPRGISGFAVPRRTTGLRLGPEALTLGMRGMVQNTIYLEGARVTRGECLGEPGAGMQVAQDAMMQGRVAIGAACVGGMKRCLQLLVRYAERRSISTGRLLDNPVLLERVGSWTAALAGLESLVAHIAKRLDAREEVPVDAYVVCKIAGAEWFWRAADDLVQFLGGRGYIESNIAAQLLRDARVTRILEGPSEALGMFLGSRVVNDAAALHKFLGETLRAPSVSTRLAAAAEAIHAKCLAKPRFGGVPDAHRWAYALIGQVATDAVLLAVTADATNGHSLAWAESRFEASIAAALAQSDGGSFKFDARKLSALAAAYRSSIGDVEQSLAGEDHALDPMLRREGGDGPLSHPTASPAVLKEEAPAPRTPRAPVTPRTLVEAASVERFIVRWIGKELKLVEASIDPSRSVFDYGLDSVTAVMLAATLEEWLDIDLGPEIVYDIPVIRRFAAHVAERQAER